MNPSLACKGHPVPPHCVCVFVKCQEKLGEVSFHRNWLRVARAEGVVKGGYNRRTLSKKHLHL